MVLHENLLSPCNIPTEFSHLNLNLYSRNHIILHSQIYKTTTWRHFNDSTLHEAYYTASKANPGTLYCIFLQWPTDDLIGKPFTLISFVNSLIVVFCNAKKVTCSKSFSIKGRKANCTGCGSHFENLTNFKIVK